MVTITVFILFLIAFLPVSLAQRSCYFSNGLIASGYSACSNATEHSGCCRLTQPNGLLIDLCTSNGLCLARNGVWNGFFFQSACTDQTWQSRQCPQACPALSTPESSIVQPCNATSGGLWCCRADGTGSCCSSAKALSVGQLIIPNSSSSSSSLFPSSTSSSSSSSSSSLSSATATPTPLNTTLSSITAVSNCSSHCTALQSQAQVSTATIGVSASLGLAFLITLGILGWREWMCRKRPQIAFVKGEERYGSERNGSVTNVAKVELSETSHMPKIYHELGSHGYERQELQGVNLSRF